MLQELEKLPAPLVKPWLDPRAYRAVSGDLIVSIYPSLDHPGFWFARKISPQGMEEFIRPAKLFLVEHFVYKTSPVLPLGVAWEPDIPEQRQPTDMRRNMHARCVYFIEAVGLERVKIGYTTVGAGQRLGALQIGSPVELRVAAWVKGDESLERFLHERFAHLRLHGEWFRLEEDLLDYVRSLGGVA